jgi:hypothetical protein
MCVFAITGNVNDVNRVFCSGFFTPLTSKVVKE